MRAMLPITDGSLWQAVKQKVAQLQENDQLKQTESSDELADLNWLKDINLLDTSDFSERNADQTKALECFSHDQWSALLDPANEKSILHGYEEVILVFQSVQPSIADFLRQQNEINIQAASLHWLQNAKMLVDVRKKQRKRIKLVSLTDLAVQINQHFPHILTNDNLSAYIPTDAFLAASSLHYQTQTELHSINKLLEMSRLPLVEKPLVENSVETFDVQGYLDSYRQSKLDFNKLVDEKTQQATALKTSQIELQKTQSANKDSLNQNKQLTEENELLIQQLHLVQESLEQQLNDNKTDKVQAEKSIESIKKEHEAFKKARAASKKELDASRKALETCQKELADAQSKNQKHLDQNKGLSEENELLIQQLHLVQESLEEMYNGNQEQSKQAKAKFEHDMNRVQTEVNELKRVLQQTQETLETALMANKALSQKTTVTQPNALLAECDDLKETQNPSQHNEDELVSIHLTASSSFKNDTLEIPQLDDKAKTESVNVLHQAEINQEHSVSNQEESEERESAELEENIALIASSEYFDAIWYLTQYPDVAESGANPAEHYLLFGYLEGRTPSTGFNGTWYLENNADVASEQINPLLHYEKFGRHEGRLANYLDSLMSV